MPTGAGRRSRLRILRNALGHLPRVRRPAGRWAARTDLERPRLLGEEVVVATADDGGVDATVGLLWLGKLPSAVPRKL